MPRHNGTWSPIYGQAWDHAKTRAAVEVVLAAGHRPMYAHSLVIGWLNRLNLWCLRGSESGRIAHLAD